jgi:ribosomal protein L10
MPKEEKIKFIEELKNKIRSATALYFLDFTGLSANDFNDFRQNARQRKMLVKVVKNQLAFRALRECGVPEQIADLLRGPTTMVFAEEDPVAPARFVKEVGKRLANLKFKGAFLENVIYTPEKFDLLATLPTKDELRAELVGVLSGSISGVVGVLEGLLSELAWIIDELQRRNVRTEAT